MRWLGFSGVSVGGFVFVLGGATYGARLSTPVFGLRVLIQPMGRGTTQAWEVRLGFLFAERSSGDGRMLVP